MPLKLSAIQPSEEAREITLNFGEAGTIEMTVLPDRYTLGRQRKIKAGLKDNNYAEVADALFEVVTKWDLLDEEGNPLPLDESGIDHLRLETVTSITAKMNEALGGPKAETSSESPRGSGGQTSRKRK